MPPDLTPPRRLEVLSSAVQIGANTSGMVAGLSIAADKDGREHCIVVVKGTFAIAGDGTTMLADLQEPLVFADVHHGDPATTSIRYESDFAPYKPRVDLLVNGSAYAPRGEAVTQMTVKLSIGACQKELLVTGDRRWICGALGVRASAPASFVTMPLTFDRAFGGRDESRPERASAELRNLVGRGFLRTSDRDVIEATALPNIEDPLHPLRGPRDTPQPAGFGVIGRGWRPRVQHAGTYDDRWIADKFPFLPDDFDPHYFQAAPIDQQVAALRGGEPIRCMHMTPAGSLVTAVPQHDMPVQFVFRDRNTRVMATLDTLLLEPDRWRMQLTWRASVPLPRKIHALRDVVVGPQPSKPHFASLGEFVAQRRGGRT